MVIAFYIHKTSLLETMIHDLAFEISLGVYFFSKISNNNSDV